MDGILNYHHKTTKSNSSTSCECLIEFSGLLSRATCSVIAIELIKYVLFERELIPDSFDYLLSRTDSTPKGVVQCTGSKYPAEGRGPVKASSCEGDSDCDSLRLQGPALQLTRPLKPAQRRQQQALDIGRSLFSEIQRAFENSVFPIVRLAFMIGSSPVTPKETYILTYPSNNLEGANVPLDVVKSTFFRKLVASDFLQSFSGHRVSPRQKLTVFLQTSPDSELLWFKPVPTFVLPKRGKTFQISLSNPALMENSFSISDGEPLNISGVNPFEQTLELSTPCPSPWIGQVKNETFDQQNTCPENIWYQAPVAFNGYR